MNGLLSKAFSLNNVEPTTFNLKIQIEKLQPIVLLITICYGPLSTACCRSLVKILALGLTISLEKKFTT